jgi:hypothetical protein
VRSSHARNSVALAAVSLALLLQALAPPGYMAGSLDDGWPVVLCPEGLPSGFLGQHGHHHHQETSGEDMSLDGHCPLGGVLDASVSLTALNLDAGQTIYATSLSFYRPPAAQRRVESHPARAPPAQA